MSWRGYFRRQSLGDVSTQSSPRSRRTSRFGSRSKFSAHLSSSKEREPLLEHRDPRVSVLLGQVIQQHQQQCDTLVSLVESHRPTHQRSSYTSPSSSSSSSSRKYSFRRRSVSTKTAAQTSLTSSHTSCPLKSPPSSPAHPVFVETHEEEEEEGEEGRGEEDHLLRRDWHPQMDVKTLRKCNGILRRENSDLKNRVGTLLGDLQTTKRAVLDTKKSVLGFEVDVLKQKLRTSIESRLKLEEHFKVLHASYRDQLASLQEEKIFWERKSRESELLATTKSREVDSLLELNRQKAECAEAQQMSHLACQDELTAAREKSRRLKIIVEKQRLEYDRLSAKIDAEVSSLMGKVRQRTRNEKLRCQKSLQVLKNQISDLQGQLHDQELKSEEIRSALVEKVAAKDSEISSVMKSKKLAEEQFREMQRNHETEIADLQARLLQLTAKIRESGDAAVAEKNFQIGSLKNQLSEFQRAAGTTAEEIATLTSQVERSKRQIAKLRKLLSSRDSSSSSRIESLEMKSQELSREVSHRDLRIKSLIEKLQTAQRSDSQKNSKMTRLVQIAKRTRSKVRELSQLNAEGSEQIRSLNECVAAKDREIESLKSALVAQEQDSRVKTEEMEEFTSRMQPNITVLSETSAQGTRQIQSLSDCVETRDREIERLKSVLELQERELNGELGLVKSSLSEKSSEIEKLKLEKRQLLAQLSTARKGLGHSTNPEEERIEPKEPWQCLMAKQEVERRLLNSFQEIEDAVRRFVSRYRFVGGVDWDKQLSQDLVQATRPQNPVEAIWTVAGFLAAYLTYDKSALYQDPTTAMTKGRTMCQGYSQLFELLMNRLEIRTVVVVGLSRDNSGDIVTETSSPTNHAWNMVTFSGHSYLLDVTNSVPKEPGCDSLLKTRLMLCPPERMIQANWPQQDNFQLLDPPISFEQFDESVVVRGGSAMFGVRPLSHHQRRIDCNVGEECFLEFEANKGCVLLPQLGGKHGELNCFVEYSRPKNRNRIGFRASGRGLWNLQIFAGLAEGEVLTEALVYNVHASGDDQADLEYPEQTTPFKTSGCRLLNPRFRTWKRGSQERIRIRIPGALCVKYEAGGGQMDLIRRDSDLWESSFVDASNGGCVKVLAEFEDSKDRLTTLLEYIIK